MIRARMFHRALHDANVALRTSLRLAIAALSVMACSSGGAPKTAPAPANSSGPASTSEAPALFTSRDGPPTSFVKSTSETRTTRTIVLRHSLSNETLFRIAADYLKANYTIYVRDPGAGFLMTNWRSSFVRDGSPELRYRTRIILRFFGEEWTQLNVTSEANWLRGEEWDVGYDAALLDSVTNQLTIRLGKQP